MTPKPNRIIMDQASNLIKVFFYGTLKRNEPNYYRLLERNVKFVSKAVTVDKYPLTVGTTANLPFLINKRGFGKVSETNTQEKCIQN